MPIITFKYEGKVYQRRIERKMGFYCMYSKGVEYLFARDIHSRTIGWHIINNKTLPEDIMPLICEELEKLYGDK